MLGLSRDVTSRTGNGAEPVLDPIRRDIVATLVGNGWAALVNILAVPLYVRFLGVEAYGLIGFFAVLQASLGVLDLGLSPTLNRMMAAYSARPEKAQEARDLVRTVEVGYWAAAGAIGLGLAAAVPFLTTYWVRTETLSRPVVESTLLLMAAVAAVQWPASLYSAGLMGLRRIVWLSSLNASLSTIRAAGAIFVLWALSPTITAFFTWQVAAAALQTTLVTLVFWRHLPPSQRPGRFNPSLLRTIWRFAAGMGATSALTLLLTQMDKVILSKVLTLRAFGYYVLAGVVAGGIGTLVSPVSTALFPRFAQTMSRNNQNDLRHLYHNGCQLVSVLAIPAVAVLTLFPRQILLVWTRNPDAAVNAQHVLSLLVIGTGLNALMQLPYSLQLAAGWTKLAVQVNLVSIVVLPPMTIMLATRFGGAGAAAVSVLLNAGYILVGLPIMHTRLLRGELRAWWLQDVGLGLTAAVITAALCRLLISVPQDRAEALSALAAIWMITQLATGLAVPHARHRLVAAVRGLRNTRGV
jgi:O-antigen/teichoic acid export membrane protein